MGEQEDRQAQLASFEKIRSAVMADTELRKALGQNVQKALEEAGLSSEFKALQEGRRESLAPLCKCSILGVTCISTCFITIP